MILPITLILTGVLVAFLATAATLAARPQTPHAPVPMEVQHGWPY